MNKFIATLLASGVSLLALTNAASADPVTIGSFILVNLLPGLIGTGIGPGLVGSLALATAALGVNVAVALASRQKIKPEEYKSTFSTGESSEIRAVGRVRVGGLKAFGNTRDYRRYRLVCHTKGPISRVETHYLGGREVTIEADGAVSSPPWGYLSVAGGGETTPGQITSNVFIQSKVGDGTETAWPDLMSDFPTHWTSSHRARGIAQSLITYISPGISSERFLKIFQNIPEYERVQRAEPVYDPRDVLQDADDQSTWEWSENGILNAVHILRSYPNFTSADFDWVGIAEQADLADATVNTLTGTEARARCWGVWPSENQRNDVMQQVLNSIGAEIVPGTDDKILVRLIDDGPTAEIEYPSKHIAEMELRYGPEAVERPNVCVVKYYSPERNYEMAEIDLTGIAWARVQDEIDRYGEKSFTVDLPFCPSASQAQRIARRMFLTARADTGIATLNQTGMAAWGLRYVSFEFPDVGTDGGVTNQVYAIDVPRDNPDEPTVEIPFLVWPSLPSWNPETDEAPAPEDLPELTQPNDLTTPDEPIAACIVEYPDETRELRVHATTPAGGTYVEVVFRLWDAGGPLTNNSMTEVDASGTFDTAYRRIKYNIWTDPTFATGWTLGTGWSQAGGFATKVDGVQSSAYQLPTIVTGIAYDIGATISDRTAGALRPRLIGGTPVEGTDITTNGAFTQTLTGGSGNTGAAYRADTSFAGKLSAPFLYHAGDFPVVELGDKLDFRKRVFDADGNASQWSDPLVVESIAINNAAPSAPTVTVETFVGPGPTFGTLLRYKITPNSLTAVRATVEFTDNNGSTWTPGFAAHTHIGLGLQSFDTEEQVAIGKGFRVTLYSSNGTAGATGQAIYT